MIHTLKHSLSVAVMLLVGVMLLVVSSCSKDETMAGEITPTDRRPASIEVGVALPEPYVTTRADEFTPKTSWAALVDGRLLYRISIFLVHKELDGNKYIIACRDLDYTKPNPPYYDKNKDVLNGFVKPADLANKASFPFGYPQQAKFYFDYQNDGVTEGLYDVIVIANGSGITSDGKTYDGMTAMQNIVERLITRVGNKEKISDADPDVNALMNDPLLNAGADGLCPQTPMMLSKIEGNKAVIPGHNSLHTSLVRSRARVRIELTNLSEKDYVNIGGLSFGTIGQTEADVFGVNKFPAKRTAPNVASPDALIPFAHSSATKTAQHIPGLQKSTADRPNTQVVFDGYILESGLNGTDQAEKIYTYKLKLNHTETSDGVPEGIDETKEGFFFDPTTKIIAAADVKNDTKYILRNRNGYYLKNVGAELNNGIKGEANTPFENFVTSDYVWEIAQNGNKNYALRSYERFSKSNDNCFLGGADFTEFGKSGKVISKTGNNGIALYYTTTRGYIFITTVYHTLTIDNSGKVSAGSSDDNINWTNNNMFDFYPLNPGSLFIPAKDWYTRPMRYINPNNENKVEQVKAVNRNDFIHIRVSVRYNDQTGLLEFTTTDWNDKQEDIEFD